MRGELRHQHADITGALWVAVAVLRMWLPNTITNAIDNTSRQLTDHNTPHIASLAQWSIGTPTPTAPAPRHATRATQVGKAP